MRGKLISIVMSVLIPIAMAGIIGAWGATAVAGPPEPRALPDLWDAPGIPVGSIILRRAYPDHPLQGTPDREVPGRGAPVRDGLREPGGGGCDKDVDLTSTLAGVVAVAAQDNVICTNADLDTYLAGTSTFVVQAGGQEAAWTHTDVTDPNNPAIVGQFVWSGASGRNTYTPDLKTFHQGVDDYIVMGLERLKVNGFCGVVIYNVTDPANPVIQSQYIGSTANQNLGPAWCDTHNVFVELDGNGEGQFIYATADAPNDMRVLDISGTNGSSVTNPIEIGRYVSPTANNDNHVHDITVLDHGGAAGRRAYLSYWDTGLVVLDAGDVTPGTSATPIIGPNTLDPDGFLMHHAWASQDGALVFIQDEFLLSSGDKPVQMWDVSDPANLIPVDGLVLGTDVPINPAHNLEIRFDIDPDRLYVGWYKLGLQAWDFTTGGFVRPNPPPRTAVEYHQAQTEVSDDAYDGAWAVRMEVITGDLYIFQSDRNFGLIVNCAGAGCAAQPTGTVEGTVTDSSTGNPIQGASVSADTSQSDTTDVNGDYTLLNVPTGTRTITASAAGFVTQQDTTNVTNGGTSIVNFALDPEPTGGTGTVKGTVRDSGGTKLGGILVTTIAPSNSDTTNNGGKYSIAGVPTDTVSMTAACPTSNPVEPVTVIDGGTVTVDFNNCD